MVSARLRRRGLGRPAPAHALHFSPVPRGSRKSGFVRCALLPGTGGDPSGGPNSGRPALRFPISAPSAPRR
jgi:hypothetical protein